MNFLKKFFSFFKKKKRKTKNTYSDNMELRRSPNTKTLENRESESVTANGPREAIALETAIRTNDSAVKTPGQVNKEQLSSIKVVITGSVGAGKTTSIFTVSEKTPITTETAPSDAVKNLKDSTTISMDYGSYTHLGRKIHLYGTPGQQRFGFMSEILTRGASGLIILISHNQKEPLEELNYYLQNNQRFLSEHPAVVGITHLDVSDKHDISIYTDFMEKQGINWSVFSVDARNKVDMMGLIEQLILLS